MRRQYLDWVGPDMGLGVYTSDPDFYQEIGSLTKVPPDEKFWPEVIFVVFGRFGKLFVTLWGTCDFHVNHLS